MGTRADFYVGRGDAAEWIGSIAYDGYPFYKPQLPEGWIGGVKEEVQRMRLLTGRQSPTA